MILKKLFPFLYKTDWHTKPDQEIRLAFTGSDGTEYYEFVNGYSCYYERYAAILDRLNEIECKVDKAFMDSFQTAMTEYLNKGDLVNASVCLQNLKDRRQYVFNQELLYDLATVWYFDKSENCYSYNPEYAEIKKKRWKNEEGRLSFFLQSHIGKYMPLPKDWEMSLVNLEAAVNQSTLTALKFHLSNIFENPKDKEKVSKLKLQVEELEGLILKKSVN